MEEETEDTTATIKKVVCDGCNNPDSILQKIREVLDTPENESIIDWANKISEEAWMYRDLTK